MIDSETTSEDLLNRLKDGDQSVFPLLVSRFKNQLMNLVLRYLGNREDAEDIVQDALVKVYIHIEKYDPAFKASTWIYTITLNLARNAYRRKNRWLILSSMISRTDEDGDFLDTVEDWSLSPEFFSDSAHQTAIIEKALSGISPIFREAVILRDMEGCSYEEIAVIMNLNMGTVKSKINRGRRMLKVLIQRELEQK